MDSPLAAVLRGKYWAVSDDRKTSFASRPMTSLLCSIALLRSQCWIISCVSSRVAWCGMCLLMTPHLCLPLDSTKEQPLSWMVVCTWV